MLSIVELRFVRLFDLKLIASIGLFVKNRNAKNGNGDLMKSSDLMFVLVVTLPLPRSNRFDEHRKTKNDNSDFVSDCKSMSDS